MGAGAGAQRGAQVILKESPQSEVDAVIATFSESTRLKLAAALAEVSPPQQPPPPAPMLLRTISRERHVALAGVDDTKGDDQGEVIPPEPELVRGYTKVDRKEELLAKLVADAMKNKGWDGVDLSTIKIQDTSGHGGSQTYKVTADGVKPAAIALHSRTESDDELGDPRMMAACDVFSKYGLVPARIAYGGDWYIDEWEGTGQPDASSEDVARQVGKFLAKVHSVPTDWFDSWRQRLIERFAQNCPEAQEAGHGLDSIPLGSHVWWYTCRRNWLESMESEKRAAFFRTDLFAPQSAVGQRLVTSHGDLHFQNMILCGSDIKAIDLEFATVNFAIYDIGYTFTCLPSSDLKRTFLETYLVASGYPAEASDVDTLFIDSKIISHTYFFSPFSCWQFDRDKLDYFKIGYDTVRADPQPYLQQSDKQLLLDWMMTIPEFRTAKAKVEMARQDKIWSALSPLTVAEPKKEPITTLAWHGSEALSCEFSHFSCACWVYLHPHQKFCTQRGAEAMCMVSTGYHYTKDDTNGQPGNMWFGWCERKKFDFNLHGQMKEVDTGDDDDLEFLDSQWHHVAVAYNAVEKQHILYVDGMPRRTTSYYWARPLRIPSIVGAGSSPSFRVPMAPYKIRSAGDKLLLVKVEGHPKEEYNGVYTQVEDATCDSLHCDMPFFKNKKDKYLKKYNSEAGGGADWSFDSRRPDVEKDWCDGGWYLATKGEELALGTFKWSEGECTISWAELEADRVGDVDAEMSAKPPDGVEHGHVCFDATYDFPAGQLMGVSLFNRCLGAEEVAHMYAKEAKEVRPAPQAPPDVVLEKVPLDKVLTWSEHAEKAEELGAQLPSKIDLILGKAEAEQEDCWVPVSRKDGLENDWVQISNTEKRHPIYTSHYEAYHSPNWGRQNKAGDWRPAFFFVKR